jgi:hypothetical protein
MAPYTSSTLVAEEKCSLPAIVLPQFYEEVLIPTPALPELCHEALFPDKGLPELCEEVLLSAVAVSPRRRCCSCSSPTLALLLL